MFDIFEDIGDKKRRQRISKTEWEAIKKLHGNKCVICGRSEKSVGVLEKAHIKAHSKGGSQVVPMCPTCHKKYDRGLLTERQLKKLGIDPKKYKRMLPKKTQGNKKKDPFAIDVPKIDISDPLGVKKKKGGRKRKKKDEFGFDLF